MPSFEETKNEALPKAQITPLEIEEGQVPSTETGPAKPRQTTCQRHRGKFICLGVTLTLGAIAGIAAAILWPKMPVFTLLNETVLTVDPLATGTGNSAKLVVQIQNPNKFAISFSDMEAKIFDYQDVYIGSVTRQERMMVPAKSTEMMTATGVFPTSAELLLVGANCLVNNLKTKVRIEATQRIHLGSLRIKYTSNVHDNVPCVARNIGGGGGGAAGGAGGAGAGAGGAGGADGAGTPSVVQQVGNAINDGINQVFGGGRGGGAGAGGAAAPAPGAPAV